MTADDPDELESRQRDPAADAETTASSLVVLVHGAWHGAWCWATLQAELDRRGVPSLAVDLPGHGASPEPIGGLHDDAAAVTALLDHLASGAAGPITLVGHSYGGAVITQAAAERDDIGQLVYLAAFALDDGESVLGCLGSMERHDVDLAAAMIPTADGSATTLDPSAAAGALYGSCPPEAVSGAPRDTIPSTYVECTQDRAVHPSHQRTMAERCSTQHVLDTDHSPFLSAVDATADIIERIAVGS